jgi:hypothetical protein
MHVRFLYHLYISIAMSMPIYLARQRLDRRSHWRYFLWISELGTRREPFPPCIHIFALSRAFREARVPIIPVYHFPRIYDVHASALHRRSAVLGSRAQIIHIPDVSIASQHSPRTMRTKSDVLSLSHDGVRWNPLHLSTCVALSQLICTKK